MTPQIKVVVVIVLVIGAVWLGNLGPSSPVNGQSRATTPELLDTAVAQGDISQEQADLYLAYALTDYEKLPIRYRSNTPWDGTLPLLHLQERVETMKVSAVRAEIVEALSAVCSTSTGSLPNNTSSTHFYVEYDTIGGGLSLSSYTTSVEAAWAKEVTTFGWAAPPVKASNPPPGNLYHVRIDTLSAGLYGYVAASGDHAGLVGDNPNTAWNDVDAYATCMVLNRDYSAFPGTPQTALDATTAHEFNHSIQFGIGGLTPTGPNAPDDAFVEGGASWMEDEVFDSANDNYNYLWPTFTMCMGEYTDSPYPYWITWRGLTERYGTGTAGGGEQVMQDFWELTSKGTSNNLSAMNTALISKTTTLADAYHAYAIAAKFNKTCSGGVSLKYVYLPLIRKDAPPTPPATWTVLVSETFEGSFPGVWDVFDNDGTTNGEYFWAKRNCQANGGTYSGWGVGGGANGAALSCGSNYPNNADSWMVFGPFSLADAAAAELNFDLWLNTEYGYDVVCRLASTDGINFDGPCTYGSSAGWITRTLNLSSYLGQPEVWIALNFYSDATNVLAEGGYVDNIVLRKCTGAGCSTAAAPAFAASSDDYVYPYCFEEAAGYLSTGGANAVHGSIATAGGSYNGSVQDNYALNWIGLPTSGGPYTVTLQNTSAGGQLRGSVVCDTGSALIVTPLPAVVGAGVSTSLANFNPSGCSSVVAVLTNQSQTANNPASCTARSYQLTVESGGVVESPLEKTLKRQRP